MIYTIEIYRIKNNDLSMDRIARSEIMFGYFMNFEKEKTRIYVVYVVIKKENMSRGMAVEKPWKGLQMPWKGLKKAWKSLNKAWKGFPNIFFWLVVLDMESRNKTKWFRFAIFLFMSRQCSRPSVVKVYINHYELGYCWGPIGTYSNNH